jgi:hypothetical protein
MAHTMTPQQVKVQVENSLPCIRTGVDDQTIAGVGDLFLSGYLAGSGKQVTNERLVLESQFVDRSNMLVRYDQDVGWSSRVDVAEGGHLVVTINNLAGRLPGNDLAKGAIFHQPLKICPWISPEATEVSLTGVIWFQRWRGARL